MIADDDGARYDQSENNSLPLIPVIGKGVGEQVEFGGLFGYAPIMPWNKFSCDDFINRGGRIPAPILALKN